MMRYMKRIWLVFVVSVGLSLTACPASEDALETQECSEVVEHEHLYFSAVAMFPFDPDNPLADQFPIGLTSGSFLSQDGPVVFEDSTGRSWDIRGVEPAGTTMGSGLIWPDFVAMGEVEIMTMTDWGGDECWNPVGLLVLREGDSVFQASSYGAELEGSPLAVSQLGDERTCPADQNGRRQVPLSFSTDGQEIQLLSGQLGSIGGLAVAVHSSSVGAVERDEDSCLTARHNWVAVPE